jgi:hypothetical protein
MIHCDRHITLLSDTDTVEDWYVCHSDLSCYVSLWYAVSVSLRRLINRSQWFIMLCLLVCCISITQNSDIFVTVIYHAMSLSILYQYHLQYTKRHSMINHCDKHITLLSDTDTVYKETYYDISLWAMFLSMLYQYHLEEWYVYHSDLSCNVS